MVPGAELLDFRDVEAFDERTAYLLSIGSGDRSRIYKTTNGGESWMLQFKNLDLRAFFDAIAFWDDRSGFVVGDPVDGRLVIVRTFDGGETWIDIPRANMPPALPGEAPFAASGTCATAVGRAHAFVATGGGSQARVFRSADRGFTWSVATTPVAVGVSSGIFSVAFRDERQGIAVGGDYLKDSESGDNLAVTTDGGRTWERVESMRARGFRSAVAYAPGSARQVVVTVGPSGADVSSDGGRTWTPLDLTGCHAVSLASGADAAWAVGEGGRIARLAGRLLPRP